MPTGHASHAVVLPSDSLPGLHGVHAAAPAPLTRPGAHVAHAAMLEPPVAPLNVPGTQRSQRIAPADDEYEPVAQGSHVASDVAESAMLDLPAAHATHTD